MNAMVNLYQRLDARLSKLSRVKYAATMGVIAFATYLGVGSLLLESVLFQAVVMGLTFGIIYYFADPR